MSGLTPAQRELLLAIGAMATMAAMSRSGQSVDPSKGQDYAFLDSLCGNPFGSRGSVQWFDYGVAATHMLYLLRSVAAGK